jgi:hypothetical protein
MPITVEDLRRRREEEQEGKQDVLQVWTALLGRASDQAVPITTRPGWNYVRIGNDETLGQARNKRVPHIYNLAVYVGYDGVSPDFQVLAIRQESYVGAGQTPIPEIEPHHTTHEWPSTGDTDSNGSDTVLVHWRQIRSLRVSRVSGMIIEIEKAPLLIMGSWAWVATQQLDLASSVPTSGARYALIYLNTSTGGIERTDGEIVVPVANIVFEDCPVPERRQFPVAAALLYAGQTSIRESRVHRRFQGTSCSHVEGTRTDTRLAHDERITKE